MDIAKKNVAALAIVLLLAFAAGYLLGVRNSGADLPDNRRGIGAVGRELDAAGGHNLAAQDRTDSLEAERKRSAESVERSRQFLGNNEEELGVIEEGLGELGKLTQESQSILGRVRQRNQGQKPAP